VSVDVEVSDRVARITLNRPETGNALDLELPPVDQPAEG